MWEGYRTVRESLLTLTDNVAIPFCTSCSLVPLGWPYSPSTAAASDIIDRRTLFATLTAHATSAALQTRNRFLVGGQSVAWVETRFGSGDRGRTRLELQIAGTAQTRIAVE